MSNAMAGEPVHPPPTALMSDRALLIAICAESMGTMVHGNRLSLRIAEHLAREAGQDPVALQRALLQAQHLDDRALALRTCFERDGPNQDHGATLERSCDAAQPARERARP